MGYASKKEIQLENGTTIKVGTNSYPVRSEVFRKICADRDLTFMEISCKIGYASNSVTSALQSGYFNNVMIKGIENVFGIKYEDYAYIPEKPVEKPVEQPKENPVQTDLIRDNPLYDTIKNAVVDGITEALAGNMKNLRGCFYTAVYSAINAAKADKKEA